MWTNDYHDTQTKSKGLLGLSHFRNSRVSTSNWEPIYQNLFSVQVVPPLGISGNYNQDDVNIILEGVQSLGAINASKASPAVEQKYKFATRSFSAAAPSETTIDLSVQFALNINTEDPTSPSNYTYNFLRQWVDLVYDPLTGRQGLKREYIAPSMTVTMHLRNGVPYWQWVFYGIFPTTGAPNPNLAYNSTSLMEGTMTFRCDWWDECCL